MLALSILSPLPSQRLWKDSILYPPRPMAVLCANSPDVCEGCKICRMRGLQGPVGERLTIWPRTVCARLQSIPATKQREPSSLSAIAPPPLDAALRLGMRTFRVLEAHVPANQIRCRRRRTDQKSLDAAVLALRASDKRHKGHKTEPCGLRMQDCAGVWSTLGPGYLD